MKPSILLCCIGVLVVLILAGGATASRVQDIYEKLMYKSNSDFIPIKDNNEPISVDVSLALLSIRDVDVDRNELEIVGWVGTEYENTDLVWNATDSTDMQLAVPDWSVWLPDVTLMNGLNAPEVTMNPGPRVVVASYGRVIYYKPLRFRVSCNLQSVETPEGANCTAKFSSWVYHGLLLDFKEPRPMDMTEYLENTKYEVVSTSASRRVMYYPCCPEPYPEVIFSVVIKKRKSGRFSIFG